MHINKPVRIDPQVRAFLLEKMRPQETYNDVLRRLLLARKNGTKK